MSPNETVPPSTGERTVAVGVTFSKTTPDKAVKKSKVGSSPTTPPPYQPDNSPGSSQDPTPKNLDGAFEEVAKPEGPAMGQTGSTPDQFLSLQVDNSNLQFVNNSLQEQIENMRKEIAALKTNTVGKGPETLENQPCLPEPVPKQMPVANTPPNPTNPNNGDALGEPGDVGDDAARKRLERICKRRASGKLGPINSSVYIPFYLLSFRAFGEGLSVTESTWELL